MDRETDVVFQQINQSTVGEVRYAGEIGMAIRS